MVPSARTGREAVLVCVAGLLLAIVMTYPLATGLSTLGRTDSGDGQLSIWNVAWVARALVTDPLNVYHTNIFYPHRNTLAYSEANLGAGVLAIPAWLLTEDAVAAHNVVVLLSFVLTFGCTYALARYLTGSPAAGVVAATLFAFCPYVFARLPHIQLLMTFGLPLSLLAFHAVVDRLTTRAAVLLGLALFVQAMFCAYYGIFAGLVAGLGAVFYAISRGLWRSFAYWRGFVLAAGLSVLLVLPFFIPYLEISAGGFGRSLNEAAHYSADWRSYFVSSAWAHRWALPLLGQWEEVLFPGVLALGLGTAGMLLPWREREPRVRTFSRSTRETAAFYAILAAAAFWMSFGPNAGLYAGMFHVLPIFTFLRAPARFGVLVALAFCLLAAIAVERLLRGRSRPAAVVGASALVLLAAAELATAPLRFRQAGGPTALAYRMLAALPHAVVAEFPFYEQRMQFHEHTRYMFNSTRHWKPLINGYSDHIPLDFREDAEVLATFPSIEALRLLKERGATFVAIHPALYPTEDRRTLKPRLDELAAYVEPRVDGGRVWLYEIVRWPE